MNLFQTLATSNSTILAVVNIAWCLIVQLTPLWDKYPKLSIAAFVAANVLAVAYKALTHKLPEPQAPANKPRSNQKG